jgi:serine/threonine-protein kinase
MDTIGKYKLVRVIGEGGMGRVYEAMDPVIGRRVAVKTISLNVVADAETRARFFREAQAAGQLSHPNLITIHDIGESEATPYIVMEYLEGMDLSRAIQKEHLSFDRKMQIMVDVCEGLAFAHAHDIVHRDIKPANIFLTNQGRVKILDFGLARGSLSDVTRTGKLVGTPNYMAPEQIRGDEIDHRADIFSTGVVFYELLSGRKAFEGESIATTMYKVLETQPEPVHLIDTQLPASLSEIIDRSLAKDRTARFQTSTEMLDAIVAAHGRTNQIERSRLQTVQLPAPAKSAPSKSSPGKSAPSSAAQTSRSKPMIWIGASLLLAGLAGFTIWSQRSSAPGPAAPLARSEAVPPPPPAPVENPASAASSPSPSTAPIPSPVPAPPRPIPVDSAAKTPARKPGAAEASTPAKPATAASPTPSPVPEVRTEPAPAPPPVVVVPPPAEPAPAPVAPFRPTTPPPAPITPPAAATPPARVEESPEVAVQAVLTRYRAALEARDIGALKRIWPALAGRQEDAIANEFQHARAIGVSLEGVDIRPSGNAATVTCRRNYSVTTGDGQTLKTTTTMIMTLARRDGGWSIDTIRHEVIR